MPENPPTASQPAAADATTKPRTKPGFIDQSLEDDIALASDCLREAAKPAISPILLEREWSADDQQAFSGTLGRCEDFVLRIQGAREDTGVGSGAELLAHTALVTALDPIIKGVRRTHQGAAERAAYGIGKGISGVSTQDLLRFAKFAVSQLAPGEEGAPPKDKLKGVKPEEIAALKALTIKYNDADWAHGQAQRTASELLALLRQEVRGVLNPQRRDLQGAADQAWTHRDPTNAAQRAAFGLQPDQPIRD